MVIVNKKELNHKIRDYLVARDESFESEFGTRNMPIIYCGDVTVKVADCSSELCGALRLGYGVYCEELGYYAKDDLSPFERKMKIIVDEYDLNYETAQIVAIRDEEVVGRVRVISGDIPIANYVDISRYSNRPLKEASRLMVDASSRGSGAVVALMGYIYGLSKKYGQIFCSSFEEGKGFYSQVGAEAIGVFRNSSFANMPLSHAFRLNFENYSEVIETSPYVNKLFVLKAVEMADSAGEGIWR